MYKLKHLKYLQSFLTTVIVYQFVSCDPLPLDWLQKEIAIAESKEIPHLRHADLTFGGGWVWKSVARSQH